MQHNWLFCHTVPKKPAACRSIKAAHALLPQKEIIATGKKTHRRRYRSLTILFDCSSDEALACTCFLTQLWTSGKYCDHGLAQEEMHNLCGLCVFLGSRSVLPPMLHEEKKHRLCRAQQCSVRHSQRPKSINRIATISANKCYTAVLLNCTTGNISVLRSVQRPTPDKKYMSFKFGRCLE